MSDSLLLFAVLAGTAPLIASTIPFYIFKNGINPRSFQILLGVSAGLLFSIATLELIPESFEMAQMKPRTTQSLSNTHDTRSLLSASYSSFSHKLLAQQLDDSELDEESTEHKGKGEGHDHEEEGNVRVGMYGLGAGFLFLVVLEQVMSGGHSHSHSFSHSHGGKSHEEDAVCSPTN